MEEDEWVLISDDTLKCLERDNVLLFIRMLLRANSRIVPRDLPSEVLDGSPVYVGSSFAC